MSQSHHWLDFLTSGVVLPCSDHGARSYAVQAFSFKPARWRTGWTILFNSQTHGGTCWEASTPLFDDKPLVLLIFHMANCSMPGQAILRRGNFLLYFSRLFPDTCPNNGWRSFVVCRWPSRLLAATIRIIHQWLGDIKTVSLMTGSFFYDPVVRSVNIKGVRGKGEGSTTRTWPFPLTPVFVPFSLFLNGGGGWSSSGQSKSAQSVTVIYLSRPFVKVLITLYEHTKRIWQSHSKPL